MEWIQIGAVTIASFFMVCSALLIMILIVYLIPKLVRPFEKLAISKEG